MLRLEKFLHQRLMKSVGWPTHTLASKRVFDTAHSVVSQKVAIVVIYIYKQILE